MGTTVQLSVNIALEGTMILLLSVMLATSIWQRKLFLTTTPLIHLLSFSIAMHIVRIVIWHMYLSDALLIYGATPFRFVYFLDYLMGYAISGAFYYYVEALVISGYQKAGIVYKAPKKLRIIMISWGVVSSLVYLGSLYVPSFYHVENGQEVSSIPAYIFMLVMIKFACVCVIILIIRNRKVLNKHDTMLTVSFILIASVFSVFDEIYKLCVSYVLMSLLIFVLYVRIDLHKGMLIERQGKEIAERETQVMLSQMQPHFIYNVLTTISSMCEMQNAIQARDMVNRFADYLRVNLDSLGKNRTISFEKELEHVKTYLWLEKVRFEDMFQIRYEIEAKDFEVPSLSIQPIVENAVKHGILPKEDSGTVTIKSYETPNDFVIVVEDDGVGFDVNKQFCEGQANIGIENVTKRLELICNGSCIIHSEIGVGTVVTMHIPKERKL